MVKVEIITCPEWGARQPRSAPRVIGQSSRIIFHHTASHHPELGGSGESREEAIAYARALQRYHMDGNGWIDSGHHFLVCRNGLILQGRWLTVSAIQAGHMVEGAHCPGMNHQIGIEHEHQGHEEMTAAQRTASAELMVWIAQHYHRKTALPVDPHSAHYATSCPGNLRTEIPRIHAMADHLVKRARL